MKTNLRDKASETRRPRFQYRLKTLLLLPLVVAALGAVGVWVGWGMVLFLIPILLTVALVRVARVSVVNALGTAVLMYVLIALALPVLQSVRTQPGGPTCQNNLKQVVVAMHAYRERYGVFPPAYVADETGRPVHSWRVLLLPFMEQQALYRQYRFDEPWDGPNNCMLAAEIVAVYNCPDDPAGPSTYTSYVLVTGPGTGWPDDCAPDIPDFPDGTSNTIAVVEVANSGIHWMEPRDLDINQALRRVNSPTGFCIRSYHREGAWVAFVDGSVHDLPNRIPPKSLKALLTAAGGEKLEKDW